MNRVHQLRTILKDAIVQLNLFRAERRTEEEVEARIRAQRIVTRLYIASLFASLVLLLFYTSFSENIYRETVVDPSESTFYHLQSLHSRTLTCDCTTIAIDYRNFLTIKAIFNQVCSSDFVSRGWIEYLGENYQPNLFVLADFRTNGASMFQVLATLCEKANKTIQDSLELFFRQQMITAEVISKDLFGVLAADSIRDWKAKTMQEFLQTLFIFRAILQGNQLLSNENNFAMGVADNRDVVVNTKGFTDTTLVSGACWCIVSAHCAGAAAIVRNATSILWIPSLQHGCSFIDSLFQSTLELFFDQSAFNELIACMPINTKEQQFRLLDRALSGTANEALESMVNRLFVDDWITDTSFSNYYKACSPRTCTYVITRRHLLAIITTVLVTFGGLSTGLKILCEVILRMLSKFRGDRSWRTIRIWLSTLGNEQNLGSRLHVFLIIITLSALYLSYALEMHMHTVVVAENPSLETYTDLSSKYPNGDLQCLCSKIAVQHRSFMNVSVTRYHQVCSSEMITLRWLDVQYAPYVAPSEDFRKLMTAYFQLIAFLCQMAQQTIDTAVAEFLTRHYVQTLMNPSEVGFHQQMQLIIRQFQLNLPISFFTSFELARDMAGINTLMTQFQNNWRFTTINSSANLSSFIGKSPGTTARVYGTCNCGLSKRCIQSATNSFNVSLPGLMVGCNALEALLQSTIECLYDNECFARIFFDVSLVRPGSSVVLQRSQITRYNLNTTVETMFKDLLTEQWFTNVSYEQYYTECAPSTCSYAYLTHSTAIDIITTLLGFYGGLVIIIRVLIVPLLLFFRFSFKRRPRQITTISTQ